MTDILKESTGKQSYARILGAGCVVTLLGVFVFAVIQGQWETVRSLAGDIAILGGTLYGVNKFAAAWSAKTPV